MDGCPAFDSGVCRPGTVVHACRLDGEYGEEEEHGSYDDDNDHDDVADAYDNDDDNDDDDDDDDGDGNDDDNDDAAATCLHLRKSGSVEGKWWISTANLPLANHLQRGLA